MAWWGKLMGTTREAGSDAMRRIERHEEWCERREQLWVQRWKDMDVASQAGQARVAEKMDALATRNDERMNYIAKEQRIAIERQNRLILAGFGALVSAMAALIVMLIHGGGHI